jgi:DNA polymerase III alpha subunit (gram-positive type)
MKIFVFDTETGGLDAQKHSVLSVGFLVGDLDTGEILDQQEMFVKLDSIEDYVITDGAFGVHGISAEQCMREGVPKTEITGAMMDMFTSHGCQLFGGHNVDPFDVEMVAYQIFDCTPAEWRANFTFRKIDTHSIVRLTAGLENIKSGATLNQTTKVLGIDMSDLGKKYHAALFDSIATFRIMCKYRSIFTDPAVVGLFG